MTDNVVSIPQRHEFDTQQDLREFWFLCVEGQPPERQGRIINEAAAAGFLPEQDRKIFLEALGL